MIEYLKKYRPWIMGVMSAVVLAWYYATDPNEGAETTARIQWVAWLLVLIAPTYWARKALMPGDSKELLQEATQKTNLPAAIMWAAMAILSGLLFLAFASMARADPPGPSLPYLPILKSEMVIHWDIQHGPTLAGQVEQETCPSLTSKKCWNPKTELKTDREYGFGLGQITVSKRFDNFAAARGLDPTLRDWEFKNRYDATKQLRTLVLMDRQNYNRLGFVTDTNERIAMSLSGYNGGMGGLLSDRRLCARIPTCDPEKWFGHVELYSLKNKVAVAGYGQSFFSINRSYVTNILKIRRLRYAAWFGEA